MRRGLEDGWKNDRHGPSHIWKKFLPFPAPVGHWAFTGNGSVFRGVFVWTTSLVYVNMQINVTSYRCTGGLWDFGDAGWRSGFFWHFNLSAQPYECSNHSAHARSGLWSVVLILSVALIRTYNYILRSVCAAVLYRGAVVLCLILVGAPGFSSFHAIGKIYSDGFSRCKHCGWILQRPRA